jgi:hypothetical protein
MPPEILTWCHIPEDHKLQFSKFFTDATSIAQVVYHCIRWENENLLYLKGHRSEAPENLVDWLIFDHSISQTIV